MGEGYVETNGVRLWYEDLGDPDGEAVVLVMGATASAISWPPELLDALTAAGHRVVRFDNRDIGLSTHVDYATDPYTLDDMAVDTVGLLDALGIDRAHFVGASMGGMISQLMAIRYPDRVRSLSLLITSPGPDDRLSPTSAEVVAIATRPATTDAELEQRGVDMWRVLTGSRFPFDEAHYRELAEMDAARGTNPEQRARDRGVHGAVAHRGARRGRRADPRRAGHRGPRSSPSTTARRWPRRSRARRS